MQTKATRLVCKIIQCMHCGENVCETVFSGKWAFKYENNSLCESCKKPQYDNSFPSLTEDIASHREIKSI